MTEKKDSPDRQREYQKHLTAYAACILELGVALRRGQYLLVSALTVHRDLALALTEEAYRRGASFVTILYQDEIASRLQLEMGNNDAVTFLPKSVRAAYEEVIERDGAFVSITGREDLAAFQGVDAERQSRSLLARTAQLDFFYQKIYTNRLKWCVAAAATAGSARVIFPDRSPEAAVSALWDEMFRICRVYEKNPLEAWRTHLASLEKRKQWLDGLHIRELTLRSPTCRLDLRLDPRARWQGGWSATPDGEYFLPNFPTEEVFTVPDYRSLAGRFTATRPLTFKNIHIENLTLEFARGELVSAEGDREAGELRRILNADPSHRRAGEIALVSSDSSVARSGLVFHDLLYDENAESHLAIGSGYSECLTGVKEMSPEEREKAGFNTSSLHIDVMFGSASLNVTARTAEGKSVTVMENGVFRSE